MRPCAEVKRATRPTGHRVNNIDPGGGHVSREKRDLFGPIPDASEITEKRCSKCRVYKSLEEFGNDKNRKDGKYPQCIPCARKSQSSSIAKPEVRDKQRRYQRKWCQKPENRGKQLSYQKTDTGKTVKRRSKLKLKYGLTEAQYNEMLQQQSNVCAVCENEFESSKHTHVDHCHATGVVRGILCNHCNRALGAVKDNTEILHSLIQYLERAREKISYH